jgi:ribosome maturation factor RimP
MEARLKTTEIVDSLVRGKITELGYELDEVEYIKEYGNMVLTLYIESENGVTLDDCEKVSRAVEPILDEKDPIEEAYYLSVSSIGIDRPLKKNKDYERNLGNKLQIKLYAPVNKKKEIMGVLKGYDDESFTVEVEKLGEVTIKRKDAALVRPWIDFE